VLDGETERQRARDDRAGRGAADEIEPVAEMDLLAEALAQDRLDPLEEGHRDGAAYAAAVERQQPLWTGTEKMAIPFTFEHHCLVHGSFPEYRTPPRRPRHPSPPSQD